MAWPARGIDETLQLFYTDPTISLPGDFTGDGLSIGLQLDARPFAEETPFRAAHAYEQATDWHTRIAPAAQAQTDRS